MVQNYPYVGLANRWFQPLTHLSSSTRRRFRSGLQIYEEKVFLQGFKQFLLEDVAGDDAVVGVVRLAECVAVVHDEVAFADEGVEFGEVGGGIGDVREPAPDDGGDLVPFLYPGLFGEGAAFVGAADEGVEEGILVDEAVKHDREVHADVVVLVPDGDVAELRLGVARAVEVLAVLLQLGEEVCPGRFGIGDEVPGAEVVLAEILVDIRDARFGVQAELGVDGVLDGAPLAGGEEEDGERGRDPRDGDSGHRGRLCSFRRIYAQNQRIRAPRLENRLARAQKRRKRARRREKGRVGARK